MSTTEQPKHYRFAFRGVKLDPYRIMQVYGIAHPAHQHAIKKLLRAGNSVKTLTQDIDEVILSLNRWKEMLNEEQVTGQQEAYAEQIINETMLASLSKDERGIYERMLKELQRTDLTIPEGKRLRKEIDKLVQSERRGRRRVRVRPAVETEVAPEGGS
jgi:hypothetical protein